MNLVMTSSPIPGDLDGFGRVVLAERPQRVRTAHRRRHRDDAKGDERDADHEDNLDDPSRPHVLVNLEIWGLVRLRIEPRSNS